MMVFSATGLLNASLPQNAEISKLESKQHNTPTKSFGVNFHRAMRSCPSYNKDITNTDADWNLIKFLYDTHITDFDGSDVRTSRIPHIIHQIWLSEEPLPKEYKNFQESWVNFHPSWHYKLWTAQDIPALDLINKAGYEIATTIAEKETIAKCEILYRYGGMYVGLDCECLKAFDPLHRACDFYAGIIPNNHILMSDSIIAATPGNPIIGISIEAVRRMSIKQNSFSPENFVHALTAAFKSFVLFTNDRSVILPLSYLDPWPRTEDNKPDNSRQRFSTKISFAMKHWFPKTVDKNCTSVSTEDEVTEQDQQVNQK
jgi:hypothetical protein